jgi:hypothetical protein
MANELGPLRAASKLVIFNPDNPVQVRKITAPAAWVGLDVAVFAQCVIPTAQVGATGFHFADRPADLADKRYTVAVYGSAAAAFSDEATLAETVAGGGGLTVEFSNA